MSDTTPLPSLPGLRMTKQRKEVYRVLMEERDHPTASEVYDRIKRSAPSISLATVYNCLDALVEHKAVKQVNFERGPSRYCPNLVEHGHFQDESTGKIHDIALKDGTCLSDVLDLPPGTNITNLDITIRGYLPQNN